MFIVQAIADFSNQTMKTAQQSENKQQQTQKKAQKANNNDKKQKQQSEEEDEWQKPQKRSRTQKHNKQLQQLKNQNKKQKPNKKDNQKQQQHQDQQAQIQYTQFKIGDKILVKESYENGWWFGHPVGKPQKLGFFPSNYVKVGVKPPAPPPPKNKISKDQEQQIPDFDPSQGTDWMKKELDQLHSGPIKSDYYQGIKGYKMVKIDQKNQNILKGNHVQFDVATGLARVPVKDQAPTAKAVRQMGYYFDYHQWNQTMNANPQQKARPDPKKKKPKKLNLKMMD